MQNGFRLPVNNLNLDWIAILYVLLSSIPIAISITDYLSAKTVTICKLKINSIMSKQIPRVGATNLKHKKVDVGFIQEAMGHETEEITRIYLEEYDDELVASSIEEALD